jgi:hypothetical protein
MKTGRVRSYDFFALMIFLQPLARQKLVNAEEKVIENLENDVFPANQLMAEQSNVFQETLSTTQDCKAEMTQQIEAIKKIEEPTPGGSQGNSRRKVHDSSRDSLFGAKTSSCS